MSSFRSLTADQRHLAAFKAKVPKNSNCKRNDGDPGIPLHVFEWAENASVGYEIPAIRNVREMDSLSRGTIRVVFAPRDIPKIETIDGMCELFDRCSIPSAFITESLQDVSQSFAARRDIDGTTYIWFHLLCKDLMIADSQIIHSPNGDDGHGNEDKSHIEARKQSQANFTWLKPGFVLKIRNPQASSLKPLRTTSSSSDSTLTTAPIQAKAEMFCFGAPLSLRDRFQELMTVASCEDLLQDPYILLEIVLQEMHKVMDQTGWAISDIFGKIELRTLSMASKPGKATKELPSDHFTSLHNLAKHTIYLRENCEAALATLDYLREHHSQVLDDEPNTAQQATRQALKYQKTLFQSTQRRLTSLDARMANIIQLSFHIVTQGDSRLMQSENQSMKTIAVMTLIFMPLGTVASIFGTQFMKLQDEKPFHITVSRDFWLLWVIAFPLTAVVLTIWRVWYMDARGRLIDDIQRPQHEHGYMGWKTLPDTIRNHLRKEGSLPTSASRVVTTKV